jgi:hypothetical protein
MNGTMLMLYQWCLVDAVFALSETLSELLKIYISRVSDMADAKIGGADTADAVMKMFFKNQLCTYE